MTIDSIKAGDMLVSASKETLSYYCMGNTYYLCPKEILLVLEFPTQERLAKVMHGEHVFMAEVDYICKAFDLVETPEQLS